MDTQIINGVLWAAVIARQVLEAVGEPVWALIEKFGTVDPNVKRLVIFVLCAAAGAFTSLNAFPVFDLYGGIVGRILTIGLIGAGPLAVHGLVRAADELITSFK